MTADADPDRSVAGMGRVRWVGVLLLAALAVLLWVQPPWVSRIQLLWFDTSQTLVPRTVKALPATIVEIDQKSIVALGQWPWPRTVLAQLVRDLAGTDENASSRRDLAISEHRGETAVFERHARRRCGRRAPDARRRPGRYSRSR